jgi:hypothetical protein
MDQPKRIRCNNINYRKGFIEVFPGIHPGFINLETWDIHPDVDISERNLSDDSIPDDAVVSNSEIEMSVKEAEELVQLLQDAISEVKSQ